AQYAQPPAYAPPPAYTPPPAYAPPAYTPPPAYTAPAYASPPATAPAYAPPPAYAAPAASAPPPAYAPAPAYAPPPGYAPAPRGAPPPGEAGPQGYAAPPASAPPAYTAPPSFAAAAGSASSAAGTDDVSEFVAKITQSTRFDRSAVARWRAPLCFSVTGLPQNEDGFVVQRLTQIAREAGARIESKGCAKGSYNFHVLFTLDAEGAAKQWYRHHRALFDENAAGPAQIARFLEPSTPPAVRVWHDATLFGTDGEPLVAVDPGDPIEPMPQTDMTG